MNQWYQCLTLTAILVGFERNFTSIEEGVGLFELCIRIFSDSSSFPTHAETNFSLDLTSLAGTAGE